MVANSGSLCVAIQQNKYSEHGSIDLLRFALATQFPGEFGNSIFDHDVVVFGSAKVMA